MTWTVVMWGLALASGLWLVVTWVLARRVTLDARIAPHVRPASGISVLASHTPVTPFPAVESLIRPFIADATRLVERWGSPNHDIAGRLARAGSLLTVERYRVEQVLWGTVGLGLGFAAAVLATTTRGAPVVTGLALTGVGALSGVLLRDYVLSRAVAAREAELTSQLPAIAELLALAVASGEGALGALERVTATARGALSGELATTLAAVRSGEPLVAELDKLAQRTEVGALRRFAEGIATAVERGTPLADVLRAQAIDARAAGQRSLVEAGGKKEIAMMIPVVFLILPITVLFAVYPGIAALSWGP